jgi:hypothetical protein
MTRFSYNFRRAIAGVLLVLMVFAMTNYYFDLGYFGHRAKGLVLFGLGLVVIYAMFLVPSREDMEEHGGGRKRKKDH